LSVAGGAVVSKETVGAFPFTSTFWRTIISGGKTTWMNGDSPSLIAMSF
jgi:hypothetical protein